MTHNRPRTCAARRSALLGTVLVAALAIGGCADKAAETGGAADWGEGAVQAQDAPPFGAAENAAPREAAADDSATEPNQVTAQERSLIYTGSITVQVDDVVSAADRVFGIATGLDGMVAGDQRTIDEKRSSAQIVLRVPAKNFTSALDQLAALGEEKSRSVNTEDVTEALIDLDERLKTQQASVDRIRALLAQATTIGEIVSLESELTRREAELNSLLQRRERMSGLVALSTITAYLLGPEADPVAEKEDIGFIAGLKKGWKGFLKSVTGLLEAGGYLLPWIVAFGLPAWLIVWLTRRRTRNLPKPSAVPPPPGPLAPYAPSPATAPAPKPEPAPADPSPPAPAPRTPASSD